MTEVSQSAYGHRARKRTWLYAVNRSEQPPPGIDWTEPAPTAQVSFCKNHGNSPLPRLSKKEAARTPTAFRDALIAIARSAHKLPRPNAESGIPSGSGGTGKPVALAGGLEER